MAEITLILGSVGLFVAGFVAWYTVWHRRASAAFERVPVSAARSAHVVRRADEPITTLVAISRRRSAGTLPDPAVHLGHSPFLWGVYSAPLTFFACPCGGASVWWRSSLPPCSAASCRTARLSSAETSAAEVLHLAETPLSAPLNCLDATCGKGSPAPAAPSAGVALVATVAGLVAFAAASASIRRRRGRVQLALPAGSPDPSFHPPQFS